MCQTVSDRGHNNSEKTSVTYLGDKGVRQESTGGKMWQVTLGNKTQSTRKYWFNQGPKHDWAGRWIALSGIRKEALFWPLLLLEKGGNPNSPGRLGTEPAMGASAWNLLKSAWLSKVWRWVRGCLTWAWGYLEVKGGGVLWTKISGSLSCPVDRVNKVRFRIPYTHRNLYES